MKYLTPLLAALALAACSQSPPDVATDITPDPGEVLYEFDGTPEMTDAEWCLWVESYFGNIDGFISYAGYEEDVFKEQARKMWRECW